MIKSALRQIAPPTPNIRRDWLPLCMFIVHEEDVRTTIRCAPCHVYLDSSVKYSVELKVYGSDPAAPIWVKKSQPINLMGVFSVSSAEIAEATGRSKMFCYVEECSRVVGKQPQSVIMTLNSQAHYSSESGRYHGHVGGNFIFGAPRKMLKGEFYYENFPGVSLERGAEFITYVMNPFTRSAEYSIILVDSRGTVYTSEPVAIPGKSVSIWSTKGKDLDGMLSPCGAVVRSDLKLSSYFASRNRDGRMVSMDHGQPFLSQLLRH